MKVNVEDISSIKKKLNIEISEEEVAKEINFFYQEVGRKAKIKGFRPGRIPRSILERYFKDYVKTETIQKLIKDTYPSALSETNLQPVSPPVIDAGEIEAGKSFIYSAIIEVKPDIKIEGYLGLNIEGKKDIPKEEEIEERLKGLQNLHANLKTVEDDRPIQKGDYVILDYEARVDNKPLGEGKANDFSVEVGSGRFIPDLEEKLIGLKSNEEKEIEVSFPENYGYTKWAGKTVSFYVKIKDIKEKILPPLDDEFAKDLGNSSLDELKAKIREEIEKEKKIASENELKDQIVDQLLKSNSFEVPESLVDEQIKTLISDTKLRLKAQGIDQKELNLSEEKLKEEYYDTAKKQVRTFLILENISAQEGITVSEEEVDDRLRKLSEMLNQKFEAIKRYYEQKGLISELRVNILMDKTLNFLLEKANIRYL